MSFRRRLFAESCAYASSARRALLREAGAYGEGRVLVERRDDTREVPLLLLDVVRLEALDRLRICAATGCGDVLVDVSRNRSRRFCGVGCANRTNVAAYRARRASSSSAR